MKAILTTVLFTSVVGIAAAQPVLVKDINTTPGSYRGVGRFRSDIITSGNYVYFPMWRSDTEDIKWWITDGTIEGTHIVDKNNDVRESFEKAAGPGGSLLYFLEKTETSKVKLMKYVPGASAPVMLLELETQKHGNFFRSKDVVMFSMQNGGNTELWKTDGTPEGTVKFKTIFERYDVKDAVDGNTLSYFTTFNNSNGYFGMWRSDGTDAGTFLIKGDVPEYQVYFEYIASGDNLYFQVSGSNNANSLWKSDGTMAGTVSLGSLPSQMDLYSLQALGSKIIFGLGNALWASDGTNAPQKISDISAELTTILNGACYFIGIDQSQGAYVLGKTDGTSAGTSSVVTLGHGGPGYASSKYIPLGDKLILPFENPGVAGTQLGISDGTAPGTHFVKQITPVGGSPRMTLFAVAGSRMIFVADDDVNGYEIWSTDGTADGTMMLLDTKPGTEDCISDFEVKHCLFLFGEKLLVHGYAGKYAPASIFLSDGTPAGTKKVFQAPNNFAMWLGDLNGKAYYNTFENIVDITSTGESDVVWTPEQNSNAGGFDYIESPVVVNNKLLFDWSLYGGSDPNSNKGSEWWVIDGTQDGAKVIDISPGEDSGVARLDGVNIGNNFIFQGTDGVHGFELWTTDGTQEGSHMIMDINPGAAGSYPYTFFKLNDHYFFISYYNFGTKLWTTDGTAQGTKQVYDFQTSIGPVPTVVTTGDKAYLALNNYGVSYLWQTDGTAAGTHIMETFQNLPINVPDVDQGIANLTAVGGKIFFTLYDSDHGKELWITDGTKNGADMIELQAGPTSSNPRLLQDIDGALLFVNDQGTWMTTTNTSSMKKFMDAVPYVVRNIGDQIYFMYKSPEYGNEFFSATLPTFEQSAGIQPVPDKTLGDPDFSITASSTSGLPVTLTATPVERVTITGNIVKIKNPGHATFKASQAGNDVFEAATDAVVTICIKPVKPVVTVKETKAASKVLQSSAAEGNQWYVNGTAIANATGATFEATDDGNYAVSSTFDGCASETSTAMSLIITGLEDEFAGAIFPNPAKDKLYIQWNGKAAQVSLIDTKGNLHFSTSFVNDVELNVGDLATGFYLLKLTTDDRQVVKKFIKE